MINKVSSNPWVEGGSYLLMGLALWVALKFSLLGALLSGLLVYSLVTTLLPRLYARFHSESKSQFFKLMTVFLLAALVIMVLTLGVWSLIVFFQSDAGNLNFLLQKLADILTDSKEQLPDWVIANLPASSHELRNVLVATLREHASTAQHLGALFGRSIVHILIGMVIGAMVALHEVVNTHHYRPLAKALAQRADHLHESFEKTVFAQVRISLINTVFTAIYLVVVLPLLGVHLPLTKTMIAVTFLAGMLPVIGNLISNAVIVIVSLSASIYIAVASLLFLVIIHKLEYFLNAKIIGSHIQAKAWELLIAILVMESVFGLAGVVAAPIYYAYIKRELIAKQLI